MLRKTMILLSVALAGVGAYVGAGRAGSSPPDLPSNLPAAALATTSLTTGTQAAIENLLSADLIDRYGITQESFSRVRQLALTEAGPLYVVPGTNGFCLYLTPALSCAQLGAGSEEADLYVTGSSGFYVGGGLATRSVANVGLRSAVDGTSVRRPVGANGVFTLRAADHIRSGGIYASVQ